MPKYKRIQVIGYGSVTSAPTRVLEVNTNSPYRKDAEIRARTLCQVAEWTRETFAVDIAGPDTLKVFVAPEFYFRFGGPGADEEALRNSYPNGDILLPNIAEEILRPFFTAPEYADWLIVPGTMFWHKTPRESHEAHPTYFNTVLVIRGGPGGPLTQEEVARNQRDCSVPVMAGLSTNQKRLMSRIDYAFGQSGVDHSKWDAALNPMFQPILDDWEWWRWHAFTVQGVTGPNGRPVVFGLEVCLEHVQSTDTPGALGVLRTMEQNYTSHCPGPAPLVDVHLVTSCGMTLDDEDGVTTRVNGIAAICDGMEPDPDATSAPWPTMGCERVTRIKASGVRESATTGEPMRTHQIPAHLQVGITGQLHDPADAIAVAQPLDLPV
ncbi:MAG TPA: hypothetical protein VFX16_05705 [Pseudonocardiaceae bacterium]|nr:hypothetical protein [Pseudonocardiaceae bacterium]